MDKRHAGERRGAGGGTLIKSALLFLASIIIFILVMVFKLNIHNNIIDIGYKISQENNSKRVLLQENKRMDLEIQYLRSPERINEIAKTTCSMRIPSSNQIIHLRTLKKKEK